MRLQRVTAYPYGGGTRVAQARAALKLARSSNQEKICMNVFAPARSVAVCVTLLGAIACGGTQTPTEPAPVYELKTETFTGTILTGGTNAFPFTVVNPGDFNLAITALAPVGTLTMGLGLGFWDAAASACTGIGSTNTATLNAVYSYTPSSAGEYCVAIFDVGNVQVSSDFTLTVTHY